MSAPLPSAGVSALRSCSTQCPRVGGTSGASGAQNIPGGVGRCALGAPGVRARTPFPVLNTAVCQYGCARDVCACVCVEGPKNNSAYVGDFHIAICRGYHFLALVLSDLLSVKDSGHYPPWDFSHPSVRITVPCFLFVLQAPDPPWARS